MGMLGFLHSLRRVIAGAAAAFSALGASAPLLAETFVFEGATTQTVDVFETAETGRQFYDGIRRSQTFVPANGANFFFHRDTRDDTLSLLLLADRRNDGTSGTLFGTITNLPTTATVTRSDDANELRLSAPGTAVFNFRFNTRGIDGGVISGLDPDNLNFQLTFTGSSGLTSTNLIDTTGITQIGGAPAPGVTFAVSTAPEPGAWALFMMGFAALAVTGKRRRARRLASASVVALYA